jgi:hypothetical protein
MQFYLKSHNFLWYFSCLFFEVFEDVEIRNFILHNYKDQIQQAFVGYIKLYQSFRNICIIALALYTENNHVNSVPFLNHKDFLMILTFVNQWSSLIFSIVWNIIQ